jgi:hypothetical protein
MKKHLILIFLISGLFFSCNEKKKDLTQSDNNISVDQFNKESEAYDLLKTQCYICHSITSASHDEIIAPPMAAIKMRYSRTYRTKESFVEAITTWATDPKLENALMRGAVKQFNVMPKQVFKKEDLEKIALYIYENELEVPDWFAEHEKEMHGNRGGMGNNK